MTALQKILRGVRHLPPRLLIYGTEGIGKSNTAEDVTYILEALPKVVERLRAFAVKA